MPHTCLWPDGITRWKKQDSIPLMSSLLLRSMNIMTKSRTSITADLRMQWRNHSMQKLSFSGQTSEG